MPLPVLGATANVPDHERATIWIPERRPARGPTVRVPGRQRGSRPRRLRRQRGDLDLPDHPGLADGRALRRLVGGAPAEPVGQGPGRRRDAVRGGRGGRAARRAAEGRARDDVHRVPGTPADGPQHVQDRRRADTDGDPCRRPDRRDPRPLDLRRPQRRDARADDRLGDARGRLGPGGARLRARGPCRDAAGPGPVPPLLRRLPHLARDQQDRAARRGRHPRAGPRRRRAGLPRPGHDARRSRRAGHGPEPRRLLPGPRGVEPVPPGGARDRPGGHGRARRPDRPPVRAGGLPRRPGRRPRRHRDGLRRRRGGGDRRHARRRRRAGRDAPDPPVPAVPRGAGRRRPAADGAGDRGPRPNEGARRRRRAALPGGRRGPGRGDGRRRSAVHDGAAGHRRTLRAVIEGDDALDDQADLRGALRRRGPSGTSRSASTTT